MILPRLLLACVCLLTVAGCLGRQTLTSPCLSTKAASDPAACPACKSDTDCYVLSNPCYESASCVPKDGNWAVTLLGCTREYEVPPASECGCVQGVCQALPEK
ncbi:MAG: hypothetical protein QM765_29320 [Myxococcales bacterium]